MTMQELFKQRGDLLKKLFAENRKLRNELKQTKEDVKFLKKVVAAALRETPHQRTVVFNIEDEPNFELQENLAGNIIVILK